MSGIRSKNTKPELLLRKALHQLGFRYRLHNRGLPGKPDLVFSSLRAVIFVHGCFWHGHDCALFKWPSSRVEFWRAKIEMNQRRDVAVALALETQGWRRLTVWECALKGKGRLTLDAVATGAAAWLRTGHENLELRGSI